MENRPTENRSLYPDFISPPRSTGEAAARHPHIISAPRRTDIPAFYAQWFINRTRAGHCHWPNPFGGQVYRVSLQPEDCIAIVFWTRNARPLLPHLPELRNRGYRFPFVLVLWRYDPVVISPITPPDYHLKNFDQLSRALEGATGRCYISFVDLYRKNERSLHRLGTYGEQEARHELLLALAQMANARGMSLHLCCDEIPAVVASAGPAIHKARCVDPDLIRQLRPEFPLRLEPKPTRPGCGCVRSIDIGAYNTCLFGCVYCYANTSLRAAVARYHRHDPADTILYRPPRLAGVNLDAIARPL
ncbi:MAG: DUF1848 domain-containing protein [Thermoleophilia bacterium]|nr:DUF1848 domain-containing protein [Thermoleophilia bacterium]